MKSMKILLLFVFGIFIESSNGIEHAKKLYNDIGTKAEESKFWRPVKEDQSSIFVYLGITFNQIMDVDEKMKILTTSVQVRQIWKNKNLIWNPKDYGDIKSIYLSHSNMWLPDIVLFNNADGKFETQYPNNPILYYNGLIDWKSPAIFQSSCEIDVKYFPYDEQICFLNFGSWTYNKQQVKLRHIKHLEAFLETFYSQGGKIKWRQLFNYSKQNRFSDGAYLTNYRKSGEWDLMETPAILSEAENHDVPYDFIRFGVKIRRKIMFYNINLIFPMVGMSIVAALSFYLPVKSGEKIDLSTLILFAIAVFFVLLGESVPPSSLVTPIINQYLITTFLLSSLSVMSTVFVLNIHFRSHLTDELITRLIRKFLLSHLPKILFISLPPKHDYLKILKQDLMNYKRKVDSIKNSLSSSSDENNCPQKFTRYLKSFTKCCKRKHHQNETEENVSENIEEVDNVSVINRQIKEACTIVSEIAEDIIGYIKFNDIQNNYMFAAVVFDRLILYIFCILSVVVTLVTYLQSPILYDNSIPMNETYFNDSKLNRLLLQQL